MPAIAEPMAHTTREHVTTETMRRELARADLAFTRRETYFMDSTWTATISALINDLLMDGLVHVVAYSEPEDRDLLGRAHRRVTGVVDYGPAGDDTLTFVDGVTLDVAECTGFTVAL